MYNMRHNLISNYFDGRLNKHHKHHDKHQQHVCHNNRYKIPKVKVSEEILVSEIRDAFDNLRYKVAMTSYDVYGFNGTCKAYQVDVVNCFSAPDDLIIISKPDNEEDLILDQTYAKKLYDEYVKNYSNLIKAETRDVQDMHTYADKVGYTLTCPKCCVTCKWAYRRNTKNGHYDMVYASTGKLECRNPLNQKEYKLPNINSNINPYPTCTQPPYCNKDGSTTIVLYPRVQDFGVCYNYQKRESQFVPMPGHNLMEYIDDRISGMIETGIEDSINNKLPGMIETEVDKTIDDKLPGMIETEIEDSINNKLPDMIETEVDKAMDDQLDETVEAVGKQIQEHINNNPLVITGNKDLENEITVTCGGA